MSRRLLTILLLLSILSGCSKREAAVPTSDVVSGAGYADQELFWATVRLSREAFPRLTLKAPHIRRFDARRLTMLEGGIRADFYNNFGLHQAILTAESGEIIEGVNRLAASGNVIVKSDSGIVLRTEELHYDEAVGRIESNEFVTLITPYDSLTGYGFTSTPDLTDWEIKNSSGATWRNFERDSTETDTAQ